MRRYLGKLGLAASLLGLCLGLMRSPASADEFASPIKEGAKALQFTLSRDALISPLQGTTLSYLTHPSASRAWRLGVTVDYFHDEPTITTTRLSAVGDTAGSVDALRSIDDRVVNKGSLVLSVERLGYSNLGSRIHTYFATGPFVGYSRSTTNDQYSDSSSRVTLSGHATRASGSIHETVGTSRSVQVGWSAAFGIGWFFRRDMSLGAEYGLNFQYSSYHTTSTTDDARNLQVTETVGSSIGASSRPVRLALTAYFGS